jgi:phenylacetate-CoA ligase
VRLVCDRPLSVDEEARLGAVIREALTYAFDLNFRYFEKELPRTPNGKFEEFVCMIR